MTVITLRSCGICIIFLSILISLSLTNIHLFFVITDSIWTILNYLDESQYEYDGYSYIHSKIYAPVETENIDYNLNVIGNIPPECNGIFFKIGPNPVRKAISIKYHWFDGDGMIHSIRLISNNNTAHYSNSYMHTLKYNLENKIFNRSIYGDSIGSTHQNGIIGFIKLLFGVFIRDNKFSPVNLNKYRKIKDSYEDGTANTNILYWNNKLLALHEGSLPFEFKYNLQSSTIESIGYYNFNNSWNNPMTAHAKIDTKTDQLFTFGAYIPPKMDKVVIGMTSKKNKESLINSATIQLSAGQMMHDFVITNKYILIFDLNVFIGENVMKQTNGKQLMAYINKTTSRIGVMVREQLEKRNKNAQIRWYEIKGCFVFHYVNAYDDNNNNEIVIIGERFTDVDLNMFQFSTNKFESSMKAYKHSKLYEWRINMREYGVKERELSINIEDNHYITFSIINSLYLGYKNNYMWSTLYYINENGIPIFDSIIKYDFKKEKVINVIKYKNKGDVGNSEFVIIPKNINEKDEDDVYLSVIIYNTDTDKSRVEIYNGKNMNVDSVAAIELKRRVPVGFHALFVSENDLQNIPI